MHVYLPLSSSTEGRGPWRTSLVHFDRSLDRAVHCSIFQAASAEKTTRRRDSSRKHGAWHLEMAIRSPLLSSRRLSRFKWYTRSLRFFCERYLAPGKLFGPHWGWKSGSPVPKWSAGCDHQPAPTISVEPRQDSVTRTKQYRYAERYANTCWLELTRVIATKNSSWGRPTTEAAAPEPSQWAHTARLVCSIGKCLLRTFPEARYTMCSSWAQSFVWVLRVYLVYSDNIYFRFLSMGVSDGRSANWSHAFQANKFRTRYARSILFERCTQHHLLYLFIYQVESWNSVCCVFLFFFVHLLAVP